MVEDRDTCWFSDDSVPFEYSGKVMAPASGLSGGIAAVRDAVHDAIGRSYDSVLVNHYPDGGSGMRFHADPGQVSSHDLPQPPMISGMRVHVAVIPALSRAGRGGRLGLLDRRRERRRDAALHVSSGERSERARHLCGASASSIGIAMPRNAPEWTLIGLLIALDGPIDALSMAP